MTRVGLAAMVVGIVTLGGAACAKPASTLVELHGALGTCVRNADLPAEAAGSEITVLLSLRHDGSLQGVPRITYSQLIGAPPAQRLFVGSVLAAIERCLPLEITVGLGGAIAGRPFRFRIIGPKATIRGRGA